MTTHLKPKSSKQAVTQVSGPQIPGSTQTKVGRKPKRTQPSTLLPPQIEVGRNMRYYRELAGKTQLEIGMAMGLLSGRTMISQYENGRIRSVRNPRVSVLERWAKACGCSPADLLRADDPYATHGAPPKRIRAGFDRREAGLKGAVTRTARRKALTQS